MSGFSFNHEKVYSLKIHNVSRLCVEGQRVLGWEGGVADFKA